MKNLKLIIFWLLFFLFFHTWGKQYDVSQQQTILLKGRVVATDTKKVLVNANILLDGSNISSVSNADGHFSLVVPSSFIDSDIVVRYLGYENNKVKVKDLVDNPNKDILLAPSLINLNELHVVSGDGLSIVKEAIDLISKNYPSSANMNIAFYREHIKKNSNYISLVEAVLDIYKSSYTGYSPDQAKIFIGRKATDVSARDTILMKFQGGINTAIMLDVAKHPLIIFNNDCAEYSFHIERMININNKSHYVIWFEPHAYITDILFRGTLYIDADSKAISRIEFNMNVEDRKDAAAVFIRKKPPKMKVEVIEASYVANYIESNGKWYFDYSSANVSFKVRWTNRLFGLFSTHYSIGAEMAVTDRYDEGISKFPRKERIRSTDIIAEEVDYFINPNFWGDYNVIEPDLEINKAIKKLSNKLLRRNN